MTTTQELLALTRAARNRGEGWLQPESVSSRSRWDDSRWELDVDSPHLRQGASVMRWDGEMQTDVVHVLKVLAWSLFAFARVGKPYAFTNAPRMNTGFNYLGRWLEKRNRLARSLTLGGGRDGAPRSILSTLTPASIATYLDDLKRHLRTAEDGRPREIDLESHSVQNYIRPLHQIWTQREHLAAAGLGGMPEEPFPLSSVMDAAQGIVTHVDGFTPPLPDEVALP